MDLCASEKNNMWAESLLESMVVNTVLAAHNSLALLILATGLPMKGIKMSSDVTSVTGRFPFEELVKVEKPGAENKDASDTEDDEDDEDEDVNDPEDEEGGDDDLSAEEGEDDGGDPEDDPEANGNAGSDEDDDEDDDDDDADDDEDEDVEEEEEEEDEEDIPQPPAKKRK